MTISSWLPKRTANLVLGILTMGFIVVWGATPAPHARLAGTAGASAISGTAFQDLNRNGVQDPGEPAMASQGIYLMDPAGQNAYAYTTTDSSGNYAFSGIAAGTYLVKYDPSSWQQIWSNWVPTTTGSIYPQTTVSVSGSAIANFGWRQIVRSASPIATYTGSSGLTIDSYDDVVSPQTIYNDLTAGTLITAEAAHVTILFDYSSAIDQTSFSVAGGPGSYSNYVATIQSDWMSWLEGGDEMLFHEWGHAWSDYYAYIVQQDSSLTSYLKVRGLYGNPNLDTSHVWGRHELIAEDYRQLFGTPNAQATAQANSQIPPAAAVPGLKQFLATTYMQPPQPTPPSNVTPPSISGTPAVGQTLTCNTGTWSGSPAPTSTYQWTRDNATVIDTAQPHTVVSADAGHTLRCTVTATNSAGSMSAAGPSVLIPIPAPPTISLLVMSPAPVKASGTASFNLSAPAMVTLVILTAKGTVIATLLTNASEAAGTVSATWLRPKSLKTGTYTVRATAVDGYGQQVTSAAAFSVS